MTGDGGTTPLLGDGGRGGIDGLLERVDRMLARAVERVVAAYGAEAAADPFRGLYISERDATRWATTRRAAPLLNAAGDEPPLLDALEPDSPLADLACLYGLSSFDLDVVGIALAPEVDLVYERLYAFLQDDVSRRRPSVDLVLSLLCPSAEAKLARREHFASDAPLVRHELIEIVPDPNATRPVLLGQFIKLDDAVVRRLLGEGALGRELAGACTLIEPGAAPADAAPSSADLYGLDRLVAEATAAREPLRLHFSGRAGRAKRDAAAALATALVAPLLVVDVDGLPAAPDEAARVVRTALREARLRGALVYLEPIDALAEIEHAARRRALLGALDAHDGVVILAGVDVVPPAGSRTGGVVTVPFFVPAYDDRRERWRAELAGAGVALPADDLEQLAGRFRLTYDQIADAVAVAANSARRRGGAPGLADLFAAARSRSHAALSGVARKIEPIHGWDQIALPEDTRRQLREICQQIVERHRVLDEWGFARRLALGKGVTALFAGPSGTGKTTAADIIARELGLDLYTVDLAAVVSKYIGETEKNLERIFTAAENTDAILFFDEADALFGKRSEVRDSHDRYANTEIAYLLQKMEQYEGVAILATNLRQNMDDAFIRRLQFVVEFPFPEEAERAQIWELLFPEEAERSDDIDFELLARQFRITGGSIKNIVLAAAFLAAGDRTPIGTRHVLRATRREYQKMGRVLTAGDLGPYAEQVPA
jgi:hypothetical protein